MTALAGAAAVVAARAAAQPAAAVTLAAAAAVTLAAATLALANAGRAVVASARSMADAAAQPATAITLAAAAATTLAAVAYPALSTILCTTILACAPNSCALTFAPWALYNTLPFTDKNRRHARRQQVRPR